MALPQSEIIQLALTKIDGSWLVRKIGFGHRLDLPMEGIN